MSKLTADILGPAIETLKHCLRDPTIKYPDSAIAAIRILLAAEGVDKKKSQDWIDHGDHTVIDEIHIQVCNLIEALPEPEKEPGK